MKRECSNTTLTPNDKVWSGTRVKTPRPKKARMSKSKIKTMLICFFDSQGVVHNEFVPPRQTVNKQVLEWLRKRVHRVRPKIADTWMLHHDNAPCHTAISVNEFLVKKGISVVPQPPYSPDLSPCDFFFFPKLKFHLKGRHFGNVDNIQKVVTDQLRHFYMKTSSTATGSGSNVSGGVWFLKGTTLKGIMLFYR